MGGGNSSIASVDQTNNIITINKSTVELLNQIINKTTNDTIINQAQICSSSSTTTLKTLFSDLQAQGDIIIDNTMNSKVTVDISCINSSTISSVVGATVSSDLTGQIDTAFKTLTSQASSGTATSSTSSNINPFDMFMKNTSSSDVNQYNTATTTNDTKTVVQSMIQNITANTFTANVMNELKSNVATAMNAEYRRMYAGGNINITSLMDSVQNITLQQITDMNIGNTVTSKLLQTFNIGVTTSTTTETAQTAKAEAEATTISTGLAGLFSAIGPSGGSSGSSSSCLCIILIFVILAVLSQLV
jgi:hypothetical protein